jgi:aryl-alcohol dehydrogenase-like predicted oxidoreductase
MTTTEIHAVVGRNRKAEDIAGALDQLVQAGKIRSVTRPTRGRTATAWEIIR